MTDHDQTIANLSNRLSIYRGHHQEKEKRYLATYNCLIEKQRQETLQLQQQVLGKESKKKSNKTGPRTGSRSVKKSNLQACASEELKPVEDDHKSEITSVQSTPNSSFVNSQYQPPEPVSHLCQQQTHQPIPHYQQQPHQHSSLHQPDQYDSQQHYYQQFQHHPGNDFRNQYAQAHQSTYENHQHYVHPPQSQPSQMQPLHHQYHYQQQQIHPNVNPKPMSQDSYCPQEFKELKDEDLACLDNFQNLAEQPLSGFAQTHEQEIFLDPNFIERFLDGI